MKKKTTNILEVFDHADSCDLEYLFPYFGVGFIYVDSRMRVFASKDDWAVVVEAIEVNQQGVSHDACVNKLCAWDSVTRTCLNTPEYITLTADGNDGPVFSDYALNEDVETISIHGNVLSVPKARALYKMKGIELRGDNISQADLLRAMTPEYRDYFFLTDNEILERLHLDLPKLLQLETWRHPVIYSDSTVEPPGQCEVFQLISRVIATQDPSQYKPTEPPNTHWSNWRAADYL